MTDSHDVLEGLGLTPELIKALAEAWNQDMLPPNTAGALLSSLQAHSKKKLVLKTRTLENGERVDVHALDQFGICSSCAAETDHFYWYDVGDAQVSNPVCPVCYKGEKGKPFGHLNRTVVYHVRLTPEVFSALATWYVHHVEAVRGDPLITQSAASLLSKVDEDDEFNDLF